MDKEGSAPKSPARERPGPTRRRRPALACEACRARKIKCDRNAPCNKCIRGKRARNCTYVPEDGSPVPRPRPAKAKTSEQLVASQARVEPTRDEHSTSALHSPALTEPASVRALPVELQPTSQPAEQSHLPTKATRDKGKLFGASHWTNTVESVSTPTQLRHYTLTCPAAQTASIRRAGSHASPADQVSPTGVQAACP
ncbi:Oleate activated transcription factor 3 [Diplodia seriata]|uniref:Oleate activated transcription factor 3 n=1 Tax=Diplodia seriata TaxID=420778 RepID=A0A1S8B8P1_9PEZI|nr:Oleate activated transcription factor 3 [Diplodia seriata]